METFPLQICYLSLGKMPHACSVRVRLGEDASCLFLSGETYLGHPGKVHRIARSRQASPPPRKAGASLRWVQQWGVKGVLEPKSPCFSPPITSLPCLDRSHQLVFSDVWIHTAKATVGGFL